MVENHDNEAPGPIPLALMHAVALHQLDSSLVLFDPVASRLVGMNQTLMNPALLPETSDDRSNMVLLFLMAERYVDDTLVAAADSGLEQCVLLGAGLNTVFYRRRYPSSRLFEVDRLGVQSWKRRRMADTRVAVPANLTYVAMNEKEDLLVDVMLAGRYDFTRSSLVIWLRRVHQSDDEIARTFAFLDKHEGQLDVVLDYCQPQAVLPEATRKILNPMLRQGEIWGEPFRSYFTSDQMGSDLEKLRLDAVEDLAWVDLLRRYRPKQLDLTDPLGARVVHARRHSAT